MENVTDRTTNPFGMRPPCEDDCDGDHAAVFGYGDANADFHLVGDHPGVHGGTRTGRPFTGTESGRRLLAVLAAVGLAENPADVDWHPRNCYCSYLHMCCSSGEPTDEEYARLEPFFDAELRAIAAHVLLPVGDRALGRVLREYTSRAHRHPADAERLHAKEVRGRGFLVIPVREPGEWTDGDAEALRSTLEGVVGADYRQTADLGRFLADEGAYLVR